MLGKVLYRSEDIASVGLFELKDLENQGRAQMVCGIETGLREARRDANRAGKYIIATCHCVAAFIL